MVNLENQYQPRQAAYEISLQKFGGSECSLMNLIIEFSENDIITLFNSTEIDRTQDT